MIDIVGKPLTRAMHFDCHTCPGVENPFSNFDAEAFAAQLAEMHVEYINFTARCNMGFSYYNTAVGKKYPRLDVAQRAGLLTDVPELAPVACRVENGRTVFETGDVLGYRAFLLEEK